MTLFIGAGGSPAGASDAGYGSVDKALIPSPNLLNAPRGPGHLTCRRIDPVTRDYALDSTGAALGMTTAQQAVELVFITDLGTCNVPTLGNELNTIQVIADSYVTDVTGKINSALAPLVAQGLIKISSIDVQRIGNSRLFITTRWTDLSTGQEQTKTLGSIA